jgi:antitoxin component of MazEF toxin-antitoxin module
MEIQKQIIKKVHQVGSSMVITIDPCFVKRLNINESTFLSQEYTDKGLLMKIKKFSDDS